MAFGQMYGLWPDIDASYPVLTRGSLSRLGSDVFLVACQWARPLATYLHDAIYVISRACAHRVGAHRKRSKTKN